MHYEMPAISGMTGDYRLATLLDHLAVTCRMLPHLEASLPRCSRFRLVPAPPLSPGPRSLKSRSQATVVMMVLDDERNNDHHEQSR